MATVNAFMQRLRLREMTRSREKTRHIGRLLNILCVRAPVPGMILIYGIFCL
jgi:hypothetical protein